MMIEALFWIQQNAGFLISLAIALAVFYFWRRLIQQQRRKHYAYLLRESARQERWATRMIARIRES